MLKEKQDLDAYGRTVEDRDNRVIRALAIGITKTEVADRTGLARGTIDRILKDHDLDIHAIAQSAHGLFLAVSQDDAFGGDAEQSIRESRVPEAREISVSRGERELRYEWSPSQEEWERVREAACAHLREYLNP